MGGWMDGWMEGRMEGKKRKPPDYIARHDNSAKVRVHFPHHHQKEKRKKEREKKRKEKKRKEKKRKEKKRKEKKRKEGFFPFSNRYKILMATCGEKQVNRYRLGIYV